MDSFSELHHSRLSVQDRSRDLSGPSLQKLMCDPVTGQVPKPKISSVFVVARFSVSGGCF